MLVGCPPTNISETIFHIPGAIDLLPLIAMMIHNYDGGGGCLQTEVGSGVDGALDGGSVTATVTAAVR